MNTPIVYDFDGLKEHIDRDAQGKRIGRISIRGRHGLHRGYEYLVGASREHCDYLVGVIPTNFARLVPSFTGLNAAQNDGLPHPEVLSFFRREADLVFVPTSAAIDEVISTAEPIKAKINELLGQLPYDVGDRKSRIITQMIGPIYWKFHRGIDLHSFINSKKDGLNRFIAADALELAGIKCPLVDVIREPCGTAVMNRLFSYPPNVVKALSVEKRLLFDLHNEEAIREYARSIGLVDVHLMRIEHPALRGEVCYECRAWIDDASLTPLIDVEFVKE